MKLSIGIVGLPNVGKSTLFNALTQKSVPAENFPFCTIDPSVGIVAVPDERLWKLSKFSKSVKTIPAVIEFVDIAGLVKGASEGEGLGNKFLSHIREVDAILQVVRIFEDEKIIHIDGKIDPVSDISVINLELILADMETIKKRLEGLGRDVKRGDKEAIKEEIVVKQALSLVEAGTLLSSKDWADDSLKILKQLNLLTLKPILYALNKKIGGNNLDDTNDDRFKSLLKYLEKNNWSYVIIDAKIESELKDFEGEEKETFRKELGGKDDGINNLISESYKLLGLITFFTTGEDETRGWTIEKNSTAPIAGTAIHTDFRDKFIRADIINWQKLLDVGSYATARERGLVRTEGKEYVVQDGDTIEFKI